MNLIYFSNVTNNTHRFVCKLDMPSYRIPIQGQATGADEPYVLVCPTYGGGKDGRSRHVPVQVIKFLNNVGNRELIRGVIGAGNMNFYEDYALAADIIAAKTNVPVLYRFEIMGTPEDVTNVQTGLERFWKPQQSPITI